MIITIAMSSSCCRRCEQLEDLRLHRHVERRRRLVGDQQLGVVDERHRDHHALAHAAGELVRVGVDAPARVGDARPGRAARPRGRAPAPWRRRGAPASPRRAGRRPCRRGAATTAGPGRSSRCRCRGCARRSSSERCSRSRPSNRIAPAICALRARVSPITVSDETLLPEPDSPTMPSVWPRLDLVARCRRRPARRRRRSSKWTFRSSTSSSGHGH